MNRHPGRWCSCASCKLRLEPMVCPARSAGEPGSRTSPSTKAEQPRRRSGLLIISATSVPSVCSSFFLPQLLAGNCLCPLLYLLLPLPVVSYCRSFGSFGAYAETRCREDFAGRHSGSLLNRARQEKIKSLVLMVSAFAIDYCFEEIR